MKLAKDELRNVTSPVTVYKWLTKARLSYATCLWKPGMWKTACTEDLYMMHYIAEGWTTRRRLCSPNWLHAHLSPYQCLIWNYHCGNYDAEDRMMWRGQANGWLRGGDVKIGAERMVVEMPLGNFLPPWETCWKFSVLSACSVFSNIPKKEMLDVPDKIHARMLLEGLVKTTGDDQERHTYHTLLSTVKVHALSPYPESMCADVLEGLSLYKTLDECYDEELAKECFGVLDPERS